MAATIEARDLVAELAQKRRTVLLGGLAVILHGLNRNTKDIDIWLDPSPDADAWASSIRELLQKHPTLLPNRIGSDPGTWIPISLDSLSAVGREDRMIRITGTDRPIDIFYIPNELESADFESIWQRAKVLEDGIKLIEEIDLIVTKQSTGRPHDESDIRFLNDKVEATYRNRLETCSAAEAADLLARFATPEIAAYAFRKSKDQDVRTLGMNLLEEMRVEGDPFAAELIQEILSEQK